MQLLALHWVWNDIYTREAVKFDYLQAERFEYLKFNFRE